MDIVWIGQGAEVAVTPEGRETLKAPNVELAKLPHIAFPPAAGAVLESTVYHVAPYYPIAAVYDAEGNYVYTVAHDIAHGTDADLVAYLYPDRVEYFERATHHYQSYKRWDLDADNRFRLQGTTDWKRCSFPTYSKAVEAGIGGLENNEAPLEMYTTTRQFRSNNTLQDTTYATATREDFNVAVSGEPEIGDVLETSNPDYPFVQVDNSFSRSGGLVGYSLRQYKESEARFG